uniref:Uncharacterized protein n=1 Tax=mine drainage metagenome TaxID=410659 RepID=E6QW99_9ZZZZ
MHNLSDFLNNLSAHAVAGEFLPGGKVVAA